MHLVITSHLLYCSPLVAKMIIPLLTMIMIMTTNHSHADADGFVLKVNGNQIYRQFEGEHEGGITLKVGEELDVLTMFLDHDEEEFFPENPEEEGRT